jgi:two-component system, cell cycle response regulator DivK
MYKILLAEDHDDNRDMLLRRLGRAGYDVRGAVDGGDALQQALDWQPDLILMDVSMPVMSGLEATQKIREKTGQAMKIIALTAHAMNESRDACMEAGCDAFATKPVDLPNLLKEIELQLGNQQQEQAA